MMTAPSIAFFHQNDPTSMQGGIERYISTIVSRSSPDVHVGPGDLARAHGLEVPNKGLGLRWLRYCWQVLRRIKSLNEGLKSANVQSIEFSRPEYLLVAWLFPQQKIVAIHGTGPKRWTISWLIHAACCQLLFVIPARVHVIGRDWSGVPSNVRKAIGSRIFSTDAWYPDEFHDRPMPPASPFKVFYAGRIAEQKNPNVLFAAYQKLKEHFSNDISLHYFGSDFESFPDEIRPYVENHGLLGPTELMKAIWECHVGILCSRHGEGSPYIVAETLGCGRFMVVSPLPTLRETYDGHPGVVFSEGYEVDDFFEAVKKARGIAHLDNTASYIALASTRFSRKELVRDLRQRLLEQD